MSFSAGQLRAARGLVGMSQDELAEASGVAKRTIADLELGTGRRPQRGTEARLLQALWAAGVRFTTDGGVAPIGHVEDLPAQGSDRAPLSA